MNLVREHILGAHPKPLPCSSCDQRFGSRGELTAHIEKVHPVRFGCGLCKEIFYSIDLVNSHKQEVHSERAKYDCIKIKSEPLKIIQTDEKAFKCDQPACDFVALDICGLQCHLDDVHNIGGTCEICGRFFKNKAYIAKHMLIHNKNRQRPYQCIVCEKRFFSTGLLKQHLSIHWSTRRLVCDFCGEIFDSKESMVPHIAMHLVVKKYVCDVCGNSFVLRNTLVVHKRTHKGGNS